jgi:hypothetical protein
MSKLINQPSLAPTRKWKYGAVVSALLVAAMAGWQAYDPQSAAQWSPLVFQIAGALGFAVPAYLVRNKI